MTCGMNNPTGLLLAPLTYVGGAYSPREMDYTFFFVQNDEKKYLFFFLKPIDKFSKL